MTDLERFVHDTLAFVTKCVPDATLDKRTSAAADIVKHFKWLFDKDGKRIKPAKGERPRKVVTSAR